MPEHRYEIRMYRKGRGDTPVQDFLNELDEKAQAKVLKVLELLAEQGPNLPRPYADVVRGKIRELRIKLSSNQYRILYFFFINKEIILLHGFRKKSQQIDDREIIIAELRMNDWIQRNNAKEIAIGDQTSDKEGNKKGRSRS